MIAPKAVPESSVTSRKRTVRIQVGYSLKPALLTAEVFLAKLAGFKDLSVYILPPCPAFQSKALLLRLPHGRSVAGACVYLG